MINWIDIKHQLPQDNESVLIYRASKTKGRKVIHRIIIGYIKTTKNSKNVTFINWYSALENRRIRNVLAWAKVSPPEGGNYD